MCNLRILAHNKGHSFDPIRRPNLPCVSAEHVCGAVALTLRQPRRPSQLANPNLGLMAQPEIGQPPSILRSWTLSKKNALMDLSQRKTSSGGRRLTRKNSVKCVEAPKVRPVVIRAKQTQPLLNVELVLASKTGERASFLVLHAAMSVPPRLRRF